MKAQFTRQEFYDMVWEKPVSHIAEELGLTYPIVRDLCRDYSIPRPKSSHWSKLKFNKPVDVEPLPIVKKDTIIDINIIKAKFSKEKSVSDEISKHMIYPSMQLPKDSKFDPIIIKSKECYIDGKIKRYDDKQLVLDLDVSKSLLPRTFRFADALVKTLRNLGYDIGKRNGDTCLKKDGIEVPFRIMEKCRREKNTASKYPDWIYVRSGVLVIKFKFCWWQEVSETPNRKLEDKFIDIIHYIERRFSEELQSKIEIKKYWEEYRRKEQVRQEREALETKELNDFKNLFRHSERYYQAQYIREYIKQVEIRAQKSSVLTDDLKLWLQWARDKADWFDPFVEKQDDLLSKVDRNNISL